MQIANGSRDVRHNDKRAGQASLCAVQANSKAIGTTQAQKERTKQWNNSTNQTWSSARAQFGIAVDVSPTGTTLTYEQIYTSGPTLEEAFITFLGEALSRYEALHTWKATTMPMVTDWSDKHETPNL
jgi:hypothetical protein